MSEEDKLTTVAEAEAAPIEEEDTAAPAAPEQDNEQTQDVEAEAEAEADDADGQAATQASQSQRDEDEVSEHSSRLVMPPSVDSEVKEDRIRARRLRIQSKRETARRAAQGLEEEKQVDLGHPALKPEPSKSNQRIAESYQALERVQDQGRDRVTVVHITADYAEAKRRREVDRMRAARRQRLQDDRETTMGMFDRISSMWSTAMEKSGVTELNDGLESQKALCKELVSQKDALIAEMQLQLKTKDDDYVRMLRAQAADVDTLMSYMDEEIKVLTAEYRHEMEHVENTFMLERDELLKAAKSEWDAAMKARRDHELKSIEDAHKRVEEREKQLEHLRINDSEEYNIIKKKLEDDINQLEQQLQTMKATYQINTEKLEYNYQVLKKRDEENSITISHQKRKLTKLTDQLNNLRAKIAKQEQHLQMQNVQLTEEYTRAADLFQDLQKKARHFTTQDRRKIDQVWQMNEDINSELAKQLLCADQAIHEQQLGIQWVRPLEVLFDSTASEQEVRSRAASAVARELLSGREVDDMSTGHLTSDTLRRALDLLCGEGDFLVDNNLDELLKSLDEHERRLIRLDAMFKALSVNTEEDMKSLAMYFIKPDQSSDAEQVELIDPNDVPAALRQFVETRQNANAKNPLKGTPSLSSRNLKFWDRLAEVVPPQHERAYAALREGMEKYHTLLTDRQKGMEDTANLRQQNNELRMLLKQYMGSKVNQQLVVPPTAVLAEQVRREQAAADAGKSY